MNLLKAVGLTLVSSLMFAAMSALVRFLGEFPVGQVVFFRAACAIPPVLLVYALRGDLRTAMHTARPLGHVLRGLISIGGMFFNFAALARLPLVDATAISFAAPLITVALAAVFLKERVRVYRWSAVSVGFVGVLVMLWPHFDWRDFAATATATAALGATFAILAAVLNAGAVIQTRRLTGTETTSSIVLYFSLSCAIAGALTLPFAWQTPDYGELAALVATGVLGGLAHILLTESYRYAPASLIAPFGYSSMIWAFVLGYFWFGEIPVAAVFAGAAIVAGAGLFVIYRERRLGLSVLRKAEGPPPAG
jgi:drug/metabolite transporter (DMT)-like permease